MKYLRIGKTAENVYFCGKEEADQVMKIEAFVQKYKEAFGEHVALPIAFEYSHNAVAPDSKVPRCMIGAISNVRNGNPLTLSAEMVKCGGGSVYTGFVPMQERIPHFVSEVEHYKKTPEMVCEYVDNLHIQLADKPYINFQRIDKLETFEGIEGLICFATPDILSGLASWAFYDTNQEDAVSVPFASGCSSLIRLAVRENQENGRRCFIGMLDPSARPLIPADELAFIIPSCRLEEMLLTMEDSALFQRAFSLVRRRI